MSSGLIHIKLQDEKGNVLKDEIKLNSFTHVGKLNLLKWFLGIYGSSTSMSFNLGYFPGVMEELKTYQSSGGLRINEALISCETVNTTYYKIHGSNTYDLDNIPGCFCKLCLVDETGSVIMAWRDIDDNANGRVFVHGPEDLSSRTPNINYDSGYTGTCDGGSFPTITGTYNESYSYYYTIVITTSGKPDHGEYRLVKTPYSYPEVYGEGNPAWIGGTGEDVYWAAYNKDGYIWTLKSETGTSARSSTIVGWICDGISGWRSSFTRADIHPDEAKATIPVAGAQDAYLPLRSECWMVTGETTNSAVAKVTIPDGTSFEYTSTPTIRTFYYDEINDATGMAGILSLPSDISFTSITGYGDYIYVGLSGGYGILRHDITTSDSTNVGDWERLANTNIGVENICKKGTAVNSDGTILYFVTDNDKLIKYDLVNEVILKTFTTGSTPALPYLFSNETSALRGNYVAVDSNDNVWVIYSTTASGISKINSAGTTITSWNTPVSTSSQSGLTYRDNALYSVPMWGIAIDIYDRPVAYDAYCNLHVYETDLAGSYEWHYYYYSASATGKTRTVTVLDDGAIAHHYSTASADSDGQNLMIQKLPIIYGWDGTSWLPNDDGVKLTHEATEELIDGLSIAFITNKRLIATNWFSFACSPGLVKDNLQRLTVDYAFYSADLQYTQTESTGTVPNAPGPYVLDLGQKANPNFIVAEIEQKSNWTITINGTEATLVTTAPTGTGVVQVANTGVLTFHSSDAGKTIVSSYYWLSL